MSTFAQDLDISNVRRHFPALEANADFVFADNAGGSQILGSVVERISEYLLKINVQMADYGYAHRAAAAVANGKAAAALFAETRPENIMLGQSATQLFETLARMIEATVLAQRERRERSKQDSGPTSSLQQWDHNDEIIISAADHEANRGAWTRLARNLGMQIVQWPVTRLAHATTASHVGLDPHVLANLITERTRIVAFTGSSNVLGSHWSDDDFKAITKLVKEKSKGHAYVCIDAVAFAPHRRLRPETWGVDIVVWSWYKVFGPHLGSMFVSQHVKETLLSKLNHHFLHGIQGSMYPFQPSSEQYELIASIAAVVDYLVWIGQTGGQGGSAPARLEYADLFGHEAASKRRQEASAAIDQCYVCFSRHEEALAQRVLDTLASMRSKIAILGDPAVHEQRAPTVAFAPQQQESSATSKDLHLHVVQKGHIGAQVGHMYAYALVSSVPGLDVDKDGVMRISFVHYNTQAEVDRVCEAIKAALAHSYGAK